MMETTFEIKGMPVWTSTITEKYDMSIRVIDTSQFYNGLIADLVEIKSSMSLEEIDKAINSLDMVDRCELNPVNRKVFIGIVYCKGCIGCSLLKTDGCFLISARAERGNIIWKIIYNRKENMRKMMWNITRRGYSLTINNIRSVSEIYSLSRREEELVKYALIRGYFDFPKRIGIREFANINNISVSTASEIIRKGTKKIVSYYFSHIGDNNV